MKYLLTINKKHLVKEFKDSSEATTYAKGFDKKGSAFLLDRILINDIKNGLTKIDPKLVAHL